MDVEYGVCLLEGTAMQLRYSTSYHGIISRLSTLHGH